MTLQELKNKLGVTKFDFYQSSQSKRFVAVTPDEIMVITKTNKTTGESEFDKDQPIYAYQHPEEASVYILSNNAPKAAAFTL